MKRANPISAAALVVAIFALVASLGGASYAKKMITGKDIKNGSITATDIKKKSLTGKQVKDKSLKAADLKPGTLPYVRTLRVPATAGATEDAARAAAPARTLYQSGPLTVYGKCYTDNSGPTTYVTIFVKTSKNGALIDSDDDSFEGGTATDYLNKNTLEIDRELMSTNTGLNSASYYGSHSADGHVWAADGTVISGLMSVGAKNGTLPGGNGPYGSGNACLFSGNFTSN
ncbi:hypothetical protein [Nocardioides sp.]|uniref:hypothetical protein n=1 Tax=Nocardioides sp. TaxID=35761 RepID=UPI003566557E